MSVTKEFATKIDTELAKLHDERWEIWAYLEDAVSSKKSCIKNPRYYNANALAEFEAKIEALNAKMVPIRARINELNSIYEQDPWTRAFLVQNNGGHVHSSMYCNTCYLSTRFFWLIQYSNDDENTIVADAGEEACTVCYPSAPADVLNRPSRIVTADKTAKAVAKAERDAKKLAKEAKFKADAPTKEGVALRILNGDTYRGNPQYDGWNTERSAISAWYGYADTAKYCTKELAKGIYYDGKPFTPETIDHNNNLVSVATRYMGIIADALAGKHGVSIETQTATLIAKWEKSRKSRNY